jgi:aspartyl-tRNA(Asn)/glutamyl-tRNA(Gln) amidotransferase subunit B
VFKRTFGWDDTANRTYVQREKEESSDYRYFPDPDLVPVTVSAERLAAVRAAMPESPAAIRTRLEAAYGITPYDSDVIVNQGLPFVGYFVAAADAAGDGKTTSNWLQQDVLRLMSERGLTIEAFPISAAALAELLKRVQAGELTTSRGREVFQRMFETNEDVAAAMAALGIEKVDESALVALCEELVAANPKLVADVKAGKMQAAGAFVGQAKKKNPNANPARVRDLCLEIIAKLA